MAPSTGKRDTRVYLAGVILMKRGDTMKLFAWDTFERLHEHILANEMVEMILTILLIMSISWCLLAVAWYILDTIIYSGEDE